MKKFAVLLLPIFATYLCAQQPQTTRTETTETTWSGTLMDAGCYSTQSHETQSKTDPAGTTTKKETTTTVTQCPVTPTTSSFGIMTSDGKFIRFDPSSNARVIELTKTKWNKEI